MKSACGSGPRGARPVGAASPATEGRSCLHGAAASTSAAREGLPGGLIRGKATAGEAITVVIGQVDPLIKHGLRQVLAAHEGFRLVETSPHGAAVERLVAQQGPRVAIFDERVEHRLLARLKVRHPSVGLLVLADSARVLTGTVLVALGVSCLARDAADADIRAAVHLAAQGKPIFLSAADDRAARLGPTVAELLSPRELEVFDLITQGRSYVEVGQELQIAPETVKSHVVNICRKLGVKNKQQLSRMSLETELQARL